MHPPNEPRPEPPDVLLAKAIFMHNTGQSEFEAAAWLRAQAERRELSVEAVARRVVARDIRPS